MMGFVHFLGLVWSLVPAMLVLLGLVIVFWGFLKYCFGK
jgi:hypothetical protein